MEISHHNYYYLGNRMMIKDLFYFAIRYNYKELEKAVRRGKEL